MHGQAPIPLYQYSVCNPTVLAGMIRRSIPCGADNGCQFKSQFGLCICKTSDTTKIASTILFGRRGLTLKFLVAVSGVTQL